jgi:NAD(P)-dependent dehydrogenase (short-subunit alcohol dehydrogenase family)
VISAQRVNRSALPHLRARGTGLVVWVSSSSVRGGTPPFLAPYFAAKAAMDALAVSYAGELAPAGIETSIIVPGAFTTGTNHFKNAGTPNDTPRASEYKTNAYRGFAEKIQKGLAGTSPPDADVGAVADAIVKVVAMPFGTRPFRTHIDPAQDGCEVVNTVADRIRAEFLRRIGLGDLLTPRRREGV